MAAMISMSTIVIVRSSAIPVALALSAAVRLFTATVLHMPAAGVFTIGDVANSAVIPTPAIIHEAMASPAWKSSRYGELIYKPLRIYSKRQQGTGLSNNEHEAITRIARCRRPSQAFATHSRKASSFGWRPFILLRAAITSDVYIVMLIAIPTLG
jgi:hypothetical protein